MPILFVAILFSSYFFLNVHLKKNRHVKIVKKKKKLSRNIANNKIYLGNTDKQDYKKSIFD